MKKIISIFIFLYCLLLSAVCFAQNATGSDTKPEMAVGMRSNGKIYVVVAVIVLIITGMFFYLISLDRKISGLEKESRNLRSK